MTYAHHRFFYFFAFLSAAVVLLAAAGPAAAMDTRNTDVRVFHQSNKAKTTSNKQVKQITDFGTDGASSIATCNLYGNSLDEIVIGAGPGQEPVVKILQRKKKNKSGAKNWKVAKRFMAYDAGMTAGVNVSCGKVTKNGRAKIVTGPGVNAGPNVKVFTRKGTELHSFFAFEETFHGGVDVAVAKTQQDRKSRIVVSSGRGESTRVRVFRLKNTGVVRELQISPFADAHTGGGNVAAGDVDGDGLDEIIVSVAGFSNGTVKIYKANKDKTVINEFIAYGTDFRGGVAIASADINLDGKDDIITAPAQRGGPDVRVYTVNGKRIGENFNAYESEFRGGTMLAATPHFDRDRKVEIITVPRKNTITGNAEWRKYIEVNLSTQTLTAYENGVVVNQFLVSTGLSPNVTPTGEFEIMRHVYNMTYSWPFAPGNPGNEYNLPDVKYNMEFTRYFYFHHAYWHNNFGNPMSHGCVNINWENSEWLYNWADVGDTVWVHY